MKQIYGQPQVEKIRTTRPHGTNSLFSSTSKKNRFRIQQKSL